MTLLLSVAQAANSRPVIRPGQIVAFDGVHYQVGERVFHEDSDMAGTIESFAPNSRQGVGLDAYHIEVRTDDGEKVTTDRFDIVKKVDTCPACNVKTGDTIDFHDYTDTENGVVYRSGKIREIFANGVAVVETPVGLRQTALEPTSIKRAAAATSSAIPSCESLAATTPEKTR